MVKSDFWNNKYFFSSIFGSSPMDQVFAKFNWSLFSASSHLGKSLSSSFEYDIRFHEKKVALLLDFVQITSPPSKQIAILCLLVLYTYTIN